MNLHRPLPNWITTQLLSAKIDVSNRRVIDQPDPSVITIDKNAEATMDQTHSASINSNEKLFPAKGIISVHQPLNVGTNRTLSSNSSIIRQKCLKKYGKRYFFQESQKRTPPMLYTFPGSGNTWCRLLVEYSIGIFSGKKYFDLLLHRLSCFSILLHLSFS